MNNAFKARKPRYKKRLDDQAEFILIVLLGGTIWAHGDLISAIFECLVLVVLIMAMILLFLLVSKHIHIQFRTKGHMKLNLQL